MKQIVIKYFAILSVLATMVPGLNAQGPGGNNFGFGLILGDPTGATIKYWFDRENALVASLGGSYFGSPRVNVEYLWHFDAFNSPVVKLYAGIGGVLGFGEGHSWFYENHKNEFYYRDNEIGIGVRAMVGINIIPKKAPIEFFADLGPLIGVIPDFGSRVDFTLGIRFYP